MSIYAEHDAKIRSIFRRVKGLLNDIDYIAPPELSDAEWEELRTALAAAEKAVTDSPRYDADLADARNKLDDQIAIHEERFDLREAIREFLRSDDALIAESYQTGGLFGSLPEGWKEKLQGRA